MIYSDTDVNLATALFDLAARAELLAANMAAALARGDNAAAATFMQEATRLALEHQALQMPCHRH